MRSRRFVSVRRLAHSVISPSILASSLQVVLTAALARSAAQIKRNAALQGILTQVDEEHISSTTVRLVVMIVETNHHPAASETTRESTDSVGHMGGKVRDAD